MLSHAGPMTLSVSDSALLFDILKGPDPRDHNALPDDGISYHESTIEASALRVAYAPTLFGVDVDDEVDRVIRDAVGRLEEAFNTSVETVSPDWKDPIGIFEVLWVAGRGVAYGTQANGRADAFGSGFTNLINQSRKFDLEDYLDAAKRRAIYAVDIHRFFDNFDILLTPTVPVLPFNAELEAPAGAAGNSEILPWTGWTPFTYPFNITGNPAASIPAGRSRTGMPVGLQVVGTRYSDSTVLAFCRHLEEKAGCSVMRGDLPELVDAIE